MNRAELLHLLIEEIAPSLPPGVSVHPGLHGYYVRSGSQSSGFEPPERPNDVTFARTFLDFVQDAVAELNVECWPRVGNLMLDVHVGLEEGELRLWFTPRGGPFAPRPPSP